MSNDIFIAKPGNLSSFLETLLSETYDKPVTTSKPNFTELQKEVEVLKMSGGKRKHSKKSKKSKKSSKKSKKSSKKQLFRENGLAAFLKYLKTPIYDDMLKMNLSGVNVAILSGAVAGYYNRKAKGEMGEDADKVELYKKAYALFTEDKDNGKLDKVIDQIKDEMATKKKEKKASKKASKAEKAEASE